MNIRAVVHFCCKESKGVILELIGGNNKNGIFLVYCSSMIAVFDTLECAEHHLFKIDTPVATIPLYSSSDIDYESLPKLFHGENKGISPKSSFPVYLNVQDSDFAFFIEYLLVSASARERYLNYV